MHRKFLFLINPISGTKNKIALRLRIEKKMILSKFPYHFMDTVADGYYSFLPGMIKAENITDIIICGGDGSISQVVSGLVNIHVNIGIIPMGSGNGLALAAGISKNLDKAIEIILKGKTAYIDGFYINKQFSCMLCGLGFDAQVAHDFAKQPRRGFSTYIKQTVKNFFIATPYHFDIHVNNIKIETEAFFISIANSNQFGNNVTIAPRASLNDGLLDIIIVNKMSKINMLYSLARQIKKGKIQSVSDNGLEKQAIYYFQSKEIIIHNPDLAPLHIDGDPAATAKIFEINILKNAFRLLQP